MVGISYKLEYRIKFADHIYRKFKKKNFKNIMDVEILLGFEF